MSRSFDPIKFEVIRSAPEETVEFVNLRLTAIGSINKPKLEKAKREGSGKTTGKKGVRKVYFSESGGFIDCPIYERLGLPEKAGIEGPAIIEGGNATTVLHPGHTAETDHWGNIIITREV